MSEIRSVSVRPLDHPLVEPFEIALGTQQEAANLLVTVDTTAGKRGYGEGSPLPPVTGETQQSAIDTARAAGELLEGRPVTAYRQLIETVRRTFPGMHTALFAVEIAILDAYCREREMPLSELFGGPPRPVETDVTIPILDPPEAADRAADATAAGYDALKLKTGTELDADIDRTVAVAESAPDATLRIDANQGWTTTETRRFADAVTAHGVELELLEQPVPDTDLPGLARCRDTTPVPIAADESLFTPPDAMQLVRMEAADVLTVKPGKSGLLGTADIAAIARAADIELMAGCMLESAIGIHASAHLVAGLGGIDYVDLDGNRLLAEDVIPDSQGPIQDISGPGHGVTPVL